MKAKGGRPIKGAYGIALVPDSRGKIHFPVDVIDEQQRFDNEIGQLLWESQWDMARQGRHRLRTYLEWAMSVGVPFSLPDLRAFRKAEEARGMKASTITSRLAGVRRAYSDLLREMDFRDALWNEAKRRGFTTIDEGRAFVKEVEERMVMRLEQRVDPSVTKYQDDDFLRLKPREVRRLLAAPGTNTLLGLRETAHIALGLAIGARANAIRILKVKHLHSEYNGRPAARVKGKGNKIRKVPYGNRNIYMEIVERWLSEAGIENSRDSDEYVIQALERDRRTPTGKIGNTAMLEHTLRKYPIDIEGEPTEVNPHDLRRTYAFSLYHEGMAVEDIAMNMGHSDKKGRPQPDTTWKYIGPREGDGRVPGYAYGEDVYRAAMREEFQSTSKIIADTQKRRKWTDRILLRIESEDRHWFWLDALLEQPTKLEKKAINRAAHSLADQGKIQLIQSRDGYRTMIAARSDVTIADLGEASRWRNEKEDGWRTARKVK